MMVWKMIFLSIGWFLGSVLIFRGVTAWWVFFFKKTHVLPPMMSSKMVWRKNHVVGLIVFNLSHWNLPLSRSLKQTKESTDGSIFRFWWSLCIIHISRARWFWPFSRRRWAPTSSWFVACDFFLNIHMNLYIYIYMSAFSRHEISAFHCVWTFCRLQAGFREIRTLIIYIFRRVPGFQAAHVVHSVSNVEELICWRVLILKLWVARSRFLFWFCGG